MRQRTPMVEYQSQINIVPTMLTLNQSRRRPFDLVLVRHYSGSTDPGPKLQLTLDGEVEIAQFSLSVDEENQVGVFILDLVRKDGIVFPYGAGIIFQVTNNKITFIRECESMNTILNTYAQIKAKEFYNNQIEFVTGSKTLITKTIEKWGKRLGYTLY